MHILTDENGNVIPHGCGHGDHEHDGHCHGSEGGGHCHGDHCHQQDGQGPSADKNTALLQYMLDHNTHHATELDQMAEKLTADGQEKAAEQIRKAVDEFQKGNLYLGLALSMVKETDA